MDRTYTTTNGWLAMLIKRAPLVPELFMDFAMLPVMIASFKHDHIYAPVPHYTLGGSYLKADGSTAPLPNNSSRKLYEAYLDRSRDMRCLPYQYASFLEFARHFKKPEGNTVYATRDSNRGKHAKKEWTAIGIRFGWELLDIYIGQYVAVKRQMWHAGERDMINMTSSKHIIIK